MFDIFRWYKLKPVTHPEKWLCSSLNVQKEIVTFEKF